MYSIAMMRYEELWMVEQSFRAAKLKTRPVYHQLDKIICGHAFCSVQALMLKKTLEDRIADLGEPASWGGIIADLDALDETEIEQDGKRFLIRGQARPGASLALRAVALPPTIRQITPD
jgi:hypothetical protein